MCARVCACVRVGVRGRACARVCVRVCVCILCTACALLGLREYFKHTVLRWKLCHKDKEGKMCGNMHIMSTDYIFFW